MTNRFASKELVVNLINLSYRLSKMLEFHVGKNQEYNLNLEEARLITKNILSDEYISSIEEQDGICHMLDILEEIRRDDPELIPYGYLYSMSSLNLACRELFRDRRVARERVWMSKQILAAATDLYEECPDTPESVKTILKRGLSEIKKTCEDIKNEHN
jgi:hypothetical protein